MSRPDPPVITIIGIPNTGKSTLFNRILGRRQSLVHNKSGMTRDILRGRGELDGRSFLLQDSGGFFPEKALISQEIIKRIFREASRSDMIIFLFDGRRELLDFEKDFFIEIAKLKKPLIPVINKVDSPDFYLLPTSYYTLKRDFLQISAEHNLGVENLLEKIASELPFHPVPLENKEPPPKITIVGKPNVGKSSLVNSLLQDEWSIVSPEPGTTRDSVDLEIRRNQKTFVLIDNAGIRKMQKIKEGTESAAVIRAERYMSRADIIVLVVDISRPIDQNDMLVAKKAVKAAKPVIIACNKWDLVSSSYRNEDLIKHIRARFHQLYFAQVITVSCKTGKNVYSLIDHAEAIHDVLNRKIKVRALNDLLKTIMNTKKFITTDGKTFAPKLVTVESYRPFFLQFHGRSLGRLRTSDELYLKKKLSKELELEGIPVFFKISHGK